MNRRESIEFVRAERAPAGPPLAISLKVLTTWEGRPTRQRAAEDGRL